MKKIGNNNSYKPIINPNIINSKKKEKIILNNSENTSSSPGPVNPPVQPNDIIHTPNTPPTLDNNGQPLPDQNNQNNN